MTAPVTERSRTITWADPIENAQQLARLSGLEALRAIITGAAPAPPIAVLMGFGLVEAEEGRAVFESEPRDFHYNPIGVVHGGFAATLLDSAMGCAVQTTCPAGITYTTLEIKPTSSGPSRWAPASCTARARSSTRAGARPRPRASWSRPPRASSWPTARRPA